MGQAIVSLRQTMVPLENHITLVGRSATSPMMKLHSQLVEAATHGPYFPFTCKGGTKLANHG